ncbi:LysR substrate-binding domain-containing protein [Sphingomonas sp. MMS24-JH45]
MPAGRVRVAAPISFGVANVAPLIADFLAGHPAVEVELHLFQLARVDIVAEGYDVALRIADLPDSSLRAAAVPDRCASRRRTRLSRGARHSAASRRPGRPSPARLHQRHRAVALSQGRRQRLLAARAGAVVGEQRRRADARVAAGTRDRAAPGLHPGRPSARRGVSSRCCRLSAPPVNLHLLTPPAPCARRVWRR